MIRITLKIFLLFVLVFGFVYQADAGDKNCTELMHEFDNYGGNLNKDQQDKLLVCQNYCSKIPNYREARDFCGIEDCNYQTARTGKPSQWCCDAARYWSNKIGVVTNPLAPLLDICGEKKLFKPANFVECASQINGGFSPTDLCCSVAKDVKKFDAIAGYNLYNYCAKRKLPTN